MLSRSTKRVRALLRPTANFPVVARAHTTSSPSPPPPPPPPPLPPHRVAYRVSRRHFTTSLPRRILPISNTSHVQGPTDVPLLKTTLGEWWDSQVELYPNSPALVSRHEAADQHSYKSKGGHVVGQGERDCLRWSYRDMAWAVDALARGLLDNGIKKGDRVGVFLGNNSTYACLQWATAKIGAILVCINPASVEQELLAALNLTGCSTLFISPTIKSKNLLPMIHSLLPSLRSTPVDAQLDDAACPELKRVYLVDNTTLGAEAYGQMLEAEQLGGRDSRLAWKWEGQGVPGAPKCSVEDVVNFQFTSGTTGAPKAVALTHSNVLNNGLYIGDCMRLQPPSATFAGERLINSPPMFHCFGLVLGNLALWTHGGCVVLPSETFNPALALRAVHLEKATAIHGVPTMFLAELSLLDALEAGDEVQHLSDLGGALDFSSLRTGIAAGSPVPDDVMRRLIKRMNLRDLTITYGQTETSPATAMSTIDDPLDKKCLTVGRVLPHTHIRIVDTQHPSYPAPETPSVAIGQPGELWSGGYALMHSYWNNAHETAQAIFTDEKTGVRWLKTGDQATMDKDGFVVITGRIKDIIIRGGENLFPVVIEARSLLLDGVQDCSIIAVPDPVMGEVVGAFVQRANSSAGRSLTGSDLRRHITRVLSHQSAPDWVWFLGEQGVEAQYPTTQSGKIRKVELRDWAKPLVQRNIGRVRTTTTTSQSQFQSQVQAQQPAPAPAATAAAVAAC